MASQQAQIDSGSVAGQDQDQRQFGNEPNRIVLRADVDHAQHAITEQEAEGGVHHRQGQDRALIALRDGGGHQNADHHGNKD